MALSKDQVLKIAKLARLELSSEEVEKYSTQLSAILDYVETLKTLNVDGIEPMAHAVMVPTPYREDVVVTDASMVEKALANAPKPEGREETFFKVPKVIG